MDGKRELRDSVPASKTQNKSGTVIGHYVSFMCNTVDPLDKKKQFRGHFIVIDNVPMHRNIDVEKQINSHKHDPQDLCRYSVTRFGNCLNQIKIIICYTARS